jgi:dethiobiotin synthetase
MDSPLRLFITGTDTDVGKTRVVAALAIALRRGLSPSVPLTIVKAVQTGHDPSGLGDAARAAADARSHLSDVLAAGLFARELRRYAKPADAYSAALAAGREPPRAGELARQLDEMPGALLVEGFGGAAAPLNAHESIAHVAAAAGLPAIVVVGLRLGCISHAVLTVSYLRSLGCRTLGAVLVDRWSPTSPDYREDVRRCLLEEMPILAVMEHGLSRAALARAAQRLEEELCKTPAL